MFPLGRPGGVREVDVDMLLASSRRRVAASSKGPGDPLRPSAGTQAQHLRIVAGRPVDLGGGPTLCAVLQAAFDDIEARATTPSSPLPPRRATAPGKTAAPKRPKRKGKTWVPLVLKYLRKMALLGCGDLVGLSGTIIAAIQARFPEFTITGEAFADAMKLIVATGTCLVAPRQSGERIWWIKLEGLVDPSSAQHRRLCRETRSRVRVEEEAAANQQPEQAAAPASQATADVEPTSTDAGRHAAQGDAGDHRDAGSGASSAASAVSAAPAQVEGLHLVQQLAMLWCHLRMAEAERCAAAGKGAAHVAGNTADPPSAASSDSDGRAQAEVRSHVQQLAMIPRVGTMLLRGYLLRIEAERRVAAGLEAAYGASPPAAARPSMAALGDGAVHVAHVSACAAEIAGTSAHAAEIAGTSAHAAEIAGASAHAAEIAARVQADDRTSSDDHKHAVELIRFDRVEVVARLVAWSRLLRRWTPSGLRRITLRAPLGDAALLHRHQSFFPVQPEPRRRDLGTLGPRGPPCMRCG